MENILNIIKDNLSNDCYQFYQKKSLKYIMDILLDIYNLHINFASQTNNDDKVQKIFDQAMKDHTIQELKNNYLKEITLIRSEKDNIIKEKDNMINMLKEHNEINKQLSSHFQKLRSNTYENGVLGSAIIQKHIYSLFNHMNVTVTDTQSANHVADLHWTMGNMYCVIESKRHRNKINKSEVDKFINDIANVKHIANFALFIGHFDTGIPTKGQFKFEIIHDVPTIWACIDQNSDVLNFVLNTVWSMHNFIHDIVDRNPNITKNDPIVDEMVQKINLNYRNSIRSTLVLNNQISSLEKTVNILKNEVSQLLRQKIDLDNFFALHPDIREFTDRRDEIKQYMKEWMLHNKDKHGNIIAIKRDTTLTFATPHELNTYKFTILKNEVIDELTQNGFGNIKKTRTYTKKTKKNTNANKYNQPDYSSSCDSYNTSSDDSHNGSPANYHDISDEIMQQYFLKAMVIMVHNGYKPYMPFKGGWYEPNTLHIDKLLGRVITLTQWKNNYGGFNNFKKKVITALRKQYKTVANFKKYVIDTDVNLLLDSNDISCMNDRVFNPKYSANDIKNLIKKENSTKVPTFEKKQLIQWIVDLKMSHALNTDYNQWSHVSKKLLFQKYNVPYNFWEEFKHIFRITTLNSDANTILDQKYNNVSNFRNLNPMPSETNA